MAESVFHTTIEHEGVAEFVEKKSVFIGHACPVSSEEEALAYVKKKKSEYADARHNVWAYLQKGEIVARYSDDGEPQGTAGVPVLDTIRKSGVSDAVVVVTRYFGGILLGAGGLVRAYAASAKLAIETAGIVTMTDFAILRMRCSYSEYQKITAALPKLGVSEDNTEYDDAVTLTVGVESTRAEELMRALSEMTNGRVTAQIVGHEERPRSAGL